MGFFPMYYKTIHSTAQYGADIRYGVLMRVPGPAVEYLWAVHYFNQAYLKLTFSHID